MGLTSYATVVVADDHPMFLDALETAVRSDERLSLTASASDGAAALELITTLQPDVAVLDLRMGEPDGIDVVARARAQGARTRVLLVSAHAQPAIARRALQAGAAGYLVKNIKAQELADAIVRVADGETVLSAYRRNLYQSVVVLLDSKDSFATFKSSLTTNPQLSVDAMREHDYYAQQSQRMSSVLSFIAYFVGGIMAVGALFGALNTMYSAVSVRSREIATLRAIGFGASAVVLSVLIEALLLSVIGALLGAALAWMFFNGNVVSTLGSNFTQVVFRLAVGPSLVVLGIVWACVIGLVGGLFPAIRAARLPVATALRAL